MLPGMAVLVVVHVVLRDTLWNTEEGVYALTARLLLHGHRLYRQVAAAQPPVVYLVGAAILWIHDSLEWLRFVVALGQLAAGVIAAQLVWRITHSAVASVVTAPVMMLAPWAVQEHGMLTPELICLPVLLAAISLCRDRRGAPATGLLCALLVFIKVPYLLPAVVIVCLSAARRRTATWALGAVVVGLIGCVALGGGAFFTDVLTAQSQSGYHSLGEIKGWWLQAAWNLVGPFIGCLFAIGLRARSVDPGRLLVLLCTAAAMIVTILSTLKQGTGLNVLVPVEAVLVPAAVCGFALALQAAKCARRQLAVAAGVTIVAGFTLAQGASLLADPGDPQPFVRAGSSNVGWAVWLTRPQLAAAVAAARHCPTGSVYAGEPSIAFVAKQQVPADQPDGFIINTKALRSVAARVRAAHPVCTGSAGPTSPSN
jgi:hypothetical protein